jgi:hypothetical protein
MWSLVLQLNPFAFLHFACQWLLPWATIVATSALIAHALVPMVAPALATETETRIISNEQSPSEQVVVLPVRVLLHALDPAEARTAPVRTNKEDRDQSVPQVID